MHRSALWHATGRSCDPHAATEHRRSPRRSSARTARLGVLCCHASLCRTGLPPSAHHRRGRGYPQAHRAPVEDTTGMEGDRCVGHLRWRGSCGPSATAVGSYYRMAPSMVQKGKTNTRWRGHCPVWQCGPPLPKPPSGMVCGVTWAACRHPSAGRDRWGLRSKEAASRDVPGETLMPRGAIGIDNRGRRPARRACQVLHDGVAPRA